MIQIVDYKAGNVTSVERALRAIGVESRLTSDPETILRAERIIFPGVGAAGAAMHVLRERGLDTALREAFARGTPLLGICLGSQIVLDSSEEEDTVCLGLLPGRSLRFRLTDPSLKVPHIGWDSFRIARPHPLLEGLRAEDEFYFDHSYYPRPDDPQTVFAETDFGGFFPCAIGRGNLAAMQFHPEKSGPPGLRILENFNRWEGAEC
jgi:glutamine amidotransferase